MRLNITDVKTADDRKNRQGYGHVLQDIVKALVFKGMVGKDGMDECRVYNVVDRSRVKSWKKVARKIERLVPEVDPIELREVVHHYYTEFTDHWEQLDKRLNPPEMKPTFNPGPSFNPDDYQEDG
jgi:hypothetical protein